MTFIIAEIGVNHGGMTWDTWSLIDAAGDADAIKFQAFTPERLEPEGRRREMLDELALSKTDLSEIYEHISSVGASEFMCTAFDVDWLDWLLSNEMLKRIKIASGCVGDRDMIDLAARSGLPVILSTGMCDEQELLTAMVELNECDVTLMHCVSEYPTPPVKICLQRMQALGMLYRHWSVKVGYSDHSGLIWPCITAAAMGADVVEAHITLDKHAYGPDHASSLEADEFAEMVEGVRAVDEWPQNYRLYQELTPEILQIHEERKAWRTSL